MVFRYLTYSVQCTCHSTSKFQITVMKVYSLNIVGHNDIVLFTLSFDLFKTAFNRCLYQDFDDV